MWFTSSWGIRIEQFRFMDIKDWCLKLFIGKVVPNHNSSFNEFLLFASLCVEAIWIECNLISHDNGDTCVVTIIHSLSMQLQNYRQVLSSDHDHDQLNIHPTCWLPPPPPWIKINVDVAIRNDVAIATAVARDDQGTVLDAYTSVVQLTYPLVIEVAAMLLGIHLTREQYWPKKVIESDCMQLVNM
ncbi:hypothetical protein PanWU01x14_174060 [Parasponia andersonii]|uniref:RNase H type-1 domain-containing protein n=1 Tax=Parasponia andersonii TaxID=3476 RepID=A0A2P5C8U7_PARAD|nr:hypothetical protein PanWU01x14_174060 [Parasponia andersonii]